MARQTKSTPTQSSVELGELLAPKRVTERLGVHEPTLTDWRYRQTGPPFVKVGRLIRYPARLLEQWLAERLRGNA
jgi:hypothetical protein